VAGKRHERVAAARAKGDTCAVRGESIERVVVVFPGALGDLLLALPALRLVRARHAGAQLTLVVAGALVALARLVEVADEVVSLDAGDAAHLFGGEELPSWLGGRPTLYSWLGSGDATLRARLGRVTRAAHFHRVEQGPGERHVASDYIRALGMVPASPEPPAPHVRPPLSALASDLLTSLAPPVLAVHAGAGSRAKRWDNAGFVQVANWWRSAGGTTVIVAGPAEAGEAPMLGPPEARDWPLPDVAALLAGVTLFLGNDSGISHLAAAVGAPGVVLFGPTDARRWRPLSAAIVALQARSTRPDGIDLRALPAQRVIAACQRRWRPHDGASP
jgi:ADP-heptose:LPS heptosyltransferase